jgi:adenylate cyclase
VPTRFKFKNFNFVAKALQRWYVALAAALVLIVGSGVCWAMRPLPDADGRAAAYPYGLTTGFENSALDLLFQLRDARLPEQRTRGMQEPITIIQIDEESIRVSGVRLQKWSRAFYAQIIETASERGAAVIGLDVILSEAGGTNPEDIADDEKLALAMETAGNVVIVEKLEAGGTPAIKPLPLFADAAYATGFADLPHDGDGFIRSLLLARDHRRAGDKTPEAEISQSDSPQMETQSDVSFSTRITEGYLLARYVAEERPVENFYEEQGLKSESGSDAVRIGGRTIPLRTDSAIQLDFRGRTPGFRHVSAGDILAGDPAALAEDLYRDRVVLIGATNVDAPDMFFTPFYESSALARFAGSNVSTIPARMPGVEIHANAVATLLWGRTLVRPAFAWRVVCVAIPLLLAALAIFALRAVQALLVTLLIVAGVLVFSVWSFNTYALVLPIASTWIGIGILAPAGLGLRYARERALRDETEAERALLMDIFSRCVSENVAETLWQQRDKLLSGERRIVSIIFTDIRGFTTISEQMPSLQLVGILNDYFSRMSAIVDHHCGHINKFIGDGLMIVFGAPVSRGDPGEARAAVACGLDMLQEVKAMNEEAKALGRPPIHIGVGIHTGEATCGVVGSERRLEYTIIGDTVNLAARLESTTKEFDVPMLISEATANLVNRRYETRAMGEVTVKGKTSSTAIYTVVERRGFPRYRFTDGIRKTAAHKIPKTYPTPKLESCELERDN